MATKKGKLWVHPKRKNIVYRGAYAATRTGDRVFQLTPVNGKGQVISLESWQLAIETGWKAV